MPSAQLTTSLPASRANLQQRIVGSVVLLPIDTVFWSADWTSHTRRLVEKGGFCESRYIKLRAASSRSLCAGLLWGWLETSVIAQTQRTLCSLPGCHVNSIQQICNIVAQFTCQGLQLLILRFGTPTIYLTHLSLFHHIDNLLGGDSSSLTVEIQEPVQYALFPWRLYYHQDWWVGRCPTSFCHPTVYRHCMQTSLPLNHRETFTVSTQSFICLTSLVSTSTQHCTWAPSLLAEDNFYHHIGTIYYIGFSNIISVVKEALYPCGPLLKQ